MGWASHAITQLQVGEPVVIRPRGHSMSGKVEDGDTVHVEPLGERVLQPDDIVLCKVLGNNRGGTNGWVSRAAIYGIVTQIGDR